jgi:plastocyanin
MNRAGLAILTLVALAACSSNSSDINQPSGQPPGNTIAIVLGAQTKGTAAFNPNPLTISLAGNGVVTWVNQDQSGGAYSSSGVTHNITADDGSFSSGLLAPGSTFETTFTVQGSFPYHCSIHPTMKGTVIVTP